MQEVRTDRAIAILKSGKNDAVFHLRHLCAGTDEQTVRRTGRPRRIPHAPGAFTDRTWFEDVRCTTSRDDNGFRLEHVIVAGTHVKTDGTCNAIFFRIIHQQMGYANAIKHLIGRFLCCIGDNRLVRLTVNHNLPATFALVVAGLGVLHQRQAPLFELVNSGVNVARHVEQQIFTHHAHEVDSSVAHVIFRVILAEACTHVTVDRV